jgi:transposase
MFIRASIQKKKTQTEYKTFKLVESFRTERGPRQRTVLNLGVDFQLPEPQWKDLANRIEEIITRQEPIFTYAPEVERLARKYVRRIIKQGGSDAVYLIRAGKSATDRESEYSPDYQVVDVNSTENEEPRSVGAEHVVLETIRELGLDEKLSEMGFSRPWKDVAIGVLAGRLINPCSELSTHWWLRYKSAIDELMGTDFSLVPQDRVYRVSDKLLKGRDELEDYLSCKERTLFNLRETIVLYDLTNTFLEGTGKLNKKARFGVSKEKRYDCPLVTLGLVLDGDGFPKRSRVFEGNVSEGKTLEKMILGLEKGALLTIKPIIIVDAGIATEDNLEWLRDNHYDYLAVSRRRKRSIPEALASRMVTVKEDKQSLVRAVLESDEKTKEVEVWCHSIQKEKKEEGIKNLFRQRFEAGLKKIEAGLTKKNGTKGYEKVIERIGRLKERYSRTARHFEIAVQKNDKDRVTSLSWSLKEDLENTDGVYCLRTNRQGLHEQELWDLYNTLRDVEDAFRCMKSELGFRPIRHHIERRSDGHLFITVLAYHILHAIRFKLRKRGVHDSWATIRERLSMHTRNTTTQKREDGKVIHIRKSSRAEPHQKAIYDALNIASTPGRLVKKIL